MSLTSQLQLRWKSILQLSLLMFEAHIYFHKDAPINNKLTLAIIWISFLRLHQHICRKMRLLIANLLITLASADVFTDPAIFERLCHFKNDGVVSCHKIQLFIDSIKSQMMNCRWTISTLWTRQWSPMPAAVLLPVRILRIFDLLDSDGDSLSIFSCRP